MLPLLADEAEIFVFKFWFNGHIQMGTHYQDELFCRLNTFDLRYRPQVYQLGCRLGQRRMLVLLTVSSATATCSLWGSLRDPAVKDILVNPEILTLPNLSPPISVETLDKPDG